MINFFIQPKKPDELRCLQIMPNRRQWLPEIAEEIGEEADQRANGVWRRESKWVCRCEFLRRGPKWVRKSKVRSEMGEESKVRSEMVGKSKVRSEMAEEIEGENRNG